jgi:hypothetical protein
VKVSIKTYTQKADIMTQRRVLRVGRNGSRFILEGVPSDVAAIWQAAMDDASRLVMSICFDILWLLDDT